MAIKKKIICLLVSGVTLGCTTLSWGEDCSAQRLKEEISKAVSLVNQNGEAAFEEFKNYRFCGDQGYIYIQDLQGVMRFHPILPHLAGKNVGAMKDADGKLFGPELLQEVEQSGESWVSFRWPKPGEKTATLKCGHAQKGTLGGTDVLVGSGLYNISEADCHG